MCTVTPSWHIFHTWQLITYSVTTHRQQQEIMYDIMEMSLNSNTSSAKSEVLATVATLGYSLATARLHIGYFNKPCMTPCRSTPYFHKFKKFSTGRTALYYTALHCDVHCTDNQIPDPRNRMVKDTGNSLLALPVPGIIPVDVMKNLHCLLSCCRIFRIVAECTILCGECLKLIESNAKSKV